MRSTRIIAALVTVALASASCGGTASSSPASPSNEPALTASPTVAPTAVPTAEAGIQGLLDARREEYGAPGGIALLVRDGERSWASSGVADLGGTPITESTRFRIASITKPIVAALVVDAVDRGEVSLDAIVGELLPGVLRPDPPVTVRQLLDHTSGIFDESNNVPSQEALLADIAKLDPALRAEAEAILEKSLAGEQVIAPDRLIVALSETHERYFVPGDGYRYSNTNYQLAAMVLETVTAKPLAALLADRVVEPLRLELTTITPPDLGSPELRGYWTSATDPSLVDITDDLSLFGNGGNGGIISTADELLAMLRAIVSGELLPAGLVAEMKKSNQQSYGLGLATYRLTCGVFYGHQGSVNGTVSIALVTDDGADGVVIALNLGSGEDPGLPALADAMLCGRG